MTKIDIDFDNGSFKKYYKELLETHTNTFKKMSAIASQQKGGVGDFVKKVGSTASTDLTLKKLEFNKQLNTYTSTKNLYRSDIQKNYALTGNKDKRDADIKKINKEYADTKKGLTERFKIETEQLEVLKHLAKILEKTVKDDVQSGIVTTDASRTAIGDDRKQKSEKIAEDLAKQKEQIERNKAKKEEALSKQQEREEAKRQQTRDREEKKKAQEQRKSEAEAKRTNREQKAELKRQTRAKERDEKGLIASKYRTHKETVERENEGIKKKQTVMAMSMKQFGFSNKASSGLSKLLNPTRRSSTLEAFTKKHRQGDSDSGLSDVLGGAMGVIGGTATGVLAGAGLTIGGAKMLYGGTKMAVSGMNNFLAKGRDRYASELNARAITGFGIDQNSNGMSVVNPVTGSMRKGDLGTVSGLANNLVGSPSDFNELGYSSENANKYMSNLARTRGYSGRAFYSDTTKKGGFGFSNNKSMSPEMTRLMSLEKMYGVDDGFFMGLSKYQQFDNNVRRSSGQRETSYDIHKLHSTMKNIGAMKNGDNSRMTEFAQTLSDRAFSQSNLLESIDTDTTIRNMAQFYKIGGSFGDSRMGERMSQVDNSLINPDNDFKQAFNFSMLRRLNPKASFVELQKMREKGLGKEGFFKESMQGLRELSGDDNDTFEQLIKSRFGVSYNQAETLRKGYDNGSLNGLTEAELNKIKSEDDFLNNLDKVREEGKKNVTPADVIKATTDDILTNLPTAFQKSFDESLKEFREDLSEQLKTLANDNTDFSEMLSRNKGAITQFLIEPLAVRMGRELGKYLNK